MLNNQEECKAEEGGKAQTPSKGCQYTKPQKPNQAKNTPQSTHIFKPNVAHGLLNVISEVDPEAKQFFYNYGPLLLRWSLVVSQKLHFVLYFYHVNFIIIFGKLIHYMHKKIKFSKHFPLLFTL